MIGVREEPIAALAEHARVPIAFTVRERLVLPTDAAALDLVAVPVEPPWVKDYDAVEPPASWPAQFDVARWGLLSAWDGGTRVGGAVVARDTPGLDLLEGRRDVAALWDLRVAPAHRGRGVGTALFRAAESWARGRGARTLLVETQDVNVPACRLYRARGCALVSARRGAYPTLPDEARLIWARRLDDGAGAAVRSAATEDR
ncbi:GNAT family N-acetyltransferase [Roseisolibacter sp. H3M3-2]|nr:GNAT family N-acetyltransferase [Roseisolibacter sp. H3M3-2]